MDRDDQLAAADREARRRELEHAIAIEQRTPSYADAATCAVAAAHLHAQARVLHTLDPDHTATVAWVACEPRPAALEARG